MPSATGSPTDRDPGTRMKQSCWARLAPTAGLQKPHLGLLPERTAEKGCPAVVGQVVPRGRARRGRNGRRHRAAAGGKRAQRTDEGHQHQSGRRGAQGSLDIFRKRQQKGILTPLQARDGFDRITATTDYTGFGARKLAIEAVVENLEIKKSVLRDFEAAAGAGSHLCLEYLVPLDHGAGNRLGAARKGRGHALLQPRREDAPC